MLMQRTLPSMYLYYFASQISARTVKERLMLIVNFFFGFLPTKFEKRFEPWS
jgi:hypothetical protein